jgi:hypothetical protein
MGCASCGTVLAPPRRENQSKREQGEAHVWVSLAVVVGMVAMAGFRLRRRASRSSAIDVGAVSDRWVAENRAERRDPFM